MLLNDEENPENQDYLKLKSLRERGLVSENEVKEMWFRKQSFEAGAKAQLKKVVEELEDDYVFAHDVEKWDASGRVCKEGCRGCAIWQSLLKEVAVVAE